MSRISACKSFATGRNSGKGGTAVVWRRNASPWINALIPATQPRQLISAIATVTSDTTAALPANR